uniref:Uncharacterized protein n=1 Tax=Spongospora subterranea TaxID=70186 RepID=A0A0H5QRL6_9EUKA|eukprot:CRZ04176.1 hypothetical protein [Spongospora subterranea]
MESSSRRKISRSRKLKRSKFLHMDRAQCLKSSRSLITEWHCLEKRLLNAKCPREIASVQERMDEMGGLGRYQDASIAGHSKAAAKFNSAKWVITCLRRRQDKYRLLDVGALSNHYLPYSSWIDCTAMDLKPRHSSVLEQDFFTYEPGQNRFDVVVLSLILNFVACKAKRGLMIRLAADLLADSESILVIVLPKACLDNSRYLDNERFINGLEVYGLQPVLPLCKVTAKLSLWILKKGVPKQSHDSRQKIIRSGSNRNNFSITF